MAGHMLEELEKQVDAARYYETRIIALECSVRWHEEFARDLYQALLGNPPAWMDGFDIGGLAATYGFLRKEPQ